MQEWRYNFCLNSCQTCTVKSFYRGLSDWMSKVTYGAYTPTFSLCKYICHRGLWRVSGGRLLLCCFFSLNRAHIPLMICAGATNLNAGHHLWPHRLGSICHSRCWQIWPNFIPVLHEGRLSYVCHMWQTFLINFLAMIYQEDAISVVK